MTNQSEIARIAANLTEAQRSALCGHYPWASEIDEEQGEAVLYQLGLWNTKPKYREDIATPLGQKVRTLLKEKRCED